MYQELEQPSTPVVLNRAGATNSTGRLPPGPTGSSWDNLAPFWGGFMQDHFDRLAAHYGNVYQLRCRGYRIVVLSGAEAIREALVKKDQVFNDRVDFAVLKQEPQCHFMELKSGEPWARHRQIVSEAMQNYFTGRWSEVESWLQEEVTDLVASIKHRGGCGFDPNRSLALANLSFIKRMIFSERCTHWDREHFEESGITLIPNGFMNANSESLIPSALQPLFRTLRGPSIKALEESLKGLDAFVGKYVEQHRGSYNGDPHTGELLRDMCDHLLSAGAKVPEADRERYQLTDRDVVNGSLIQFVGAGTAVPTFTLRWALVYLVRYPEIQRRLHRELDQMLEGRTPTLADKSKLPYCQAFVNEVMRHAPITPLPAVQYKAKEDTTIQGYRVEKDSPVIINYYSLTRDSGIWDDPERFDPSRFLNGDGELRKDLQNKFFPFGLGSRRCIGEHIGRMQLFLLCANLVHAFQFVEPPGGRMEVTSYPGFFMVPKPYQLAALPRWTGNEQEAL